MGGSQDQLFLLSITKFVGQPNSRKLLVTARNRLF